MPDRQDEGTLYQTSAAGQDACERYREVRDTCLVRTLTTCSTVDRDEIGYAARVLHALSGLYDQAARAATSL